MSDRTFQIFPAEKLAIVRWFGPVTYQEVLAWMDEMSAHPDFNPEYDGVVDLRKSDLTRMSPAQVKAIAQHMIDKQLTKGRWVHLAANPMETALSMMYSRAVSEQYRMRVFSTVESAAEYLGHDPSALQRVTDTAAPRNSR